MSEIHEGGCLCGSVRYRAKGGPARVSVCHCTDCQRRAGSAFAVAAHFKHKNLEMTCGPVSKSSRRVPSGRRLGNSGFRPNLNL